MYAEWQMIALSVPSGYDRDNADIYFNEKLHAFPINRNFFINLLEDIPNKICFSGTATIVREENKIIK